MAFTPAFTAAFVKPDDIRDGDENAGGVINIDGTTAKVTLTSHDNFNVTDSAIDPEVTRTQHDNFRAVDSAINPNVAETQHDSFLSVNDSIDPEVTKTQHDSFLAVTDSINPEVTETQHDSFLSVDNFATSDIEVTETQHDSFLPVSNFATSAIEVTETQHDSFLAVDNITPSDIEVTETQHNNFRPVTNSIDPEVTETQHDNFLAVSNPSQAPVTNDFDIMSDASTVTFSAILAKEKNIPISFNYQPYTTLDTDTQSVSGDGRVILGVSTYTLLIYGGFEDTDREDLFTALRGCDRFRFNSATLSVQGLGVISENKINDDFTIVVISFLPLTHLNSAGGVML